MGQTQTKKSRKRERKFGIREEYFIKNGGIFLEKQLAISRGRNTGLKELKTLSLNEIEKATNNYDPSLILGSIQSTVYKGVINDQVIAIKVPRNFQLNRSLIDLYVTEAATSMVMNHENLVKIYGCCLETYIPMMVYEYLPNGSLFKQLHSKNGHIKWSDRVRIAADTAYGLSYMHNGLSIPVVHRDVQSYSILLDESFRAKLSNFGYSVALTPEETSQRGPVLGFPGCIDPEYVETGEVTEKCDVYSFGVLLLELLTGKQPIEMAMQGMDLVDVFVSSVGKNSMMEMIDIAILEQAKYNEIRQVAWLALKCVAKTGEERPTMINVVQEFRRIQRSKEKQC